MSTTHTAGKLTLGIDNVLYAGEFMSVVQVAKVRLGGPTSSDQETANAEHLALCWNSHEGLVAALEAIVDAWSAGDALGRGPHRDSEPRASVHAALAAAQGVPA